MQAMKKKIQSQRGASLTYALLVFLVCAVVGSAVLTAGTAAGGRMDNLAEMDQRYYSVNSAARLMIDMITGDEIQVEKTTPDTDGASADPGSDPAPAPASEFHYFRLKGTEREVIDVSSGFPSLTVEAGDRIARGLSANQVRTITVSADKDGVMTVEGTETIYPDGRLEIELGNQIESADDEHYVIHLCFAPEVFQQLREKDIAQNLEIETTTLKWKLTEIWQDNAAI